MKILAIGESIIDKVYRVDDIEMAKLEYHTPETHVGGTVIAALIVLARLGVDCTIVTSLGRDDESKIIKKALKHEGIKILHKIQKKTKVNTIIVNNLTGERKKVRGKTIHPDIKNLDRSFLRQFDLIIMDRHEKTAFYEVIAKKRPSTKVLIDPSIEVSTHTLEMIRNADYPIIPIESLVTMCTGDLYACIEKMYQISHKPLTITAGDLGSIIFDGLSFQTIAPYTVSAIDVNGAGDVYRGAFAYGITQGWDIIKCATSGNYVAALQCTRTGNVAAIPTKDEMLEFDIIEKHRTVDMEKILKQFTTLRVV